MSDNKALRAGIEFALYPIPAEYGHFALSQFDRDYDIYTDYWAGKLNRQSVECHLQDRGLSASAGLTNGRHGGVGDLRLFVREAAALNMRTK